MRVVVVNKSKYGINRIVQELSKYAKVLSRKRIDKNLYIIELNQPINIQLVKHELREYIKYLGADVGIRVEFGESCDNRYASNEVIKAANRAKVNIRGMCQAGTILNRSGKGVMLNVYVRIDELINDDKWHKFVNEMSEAKGCNKIEAGV